MVTVGSDPGRELMDAIGICNMTSKTAGDFLGRSSLTIQAYVIGKRRPPEDLARRLLELWQDAAFGNDMVDRHGKPFPECVLAIRRVRSHPAMSEFDRLRQEMLLNPQPDPDATVNLGPEPDQTYDDRFGEDDDPYDRSLDDGEER